MLPKQFTALTSAADGILREIITDCDVSLPCPENVSPLQVTKVHTKALWDTGATNCCITKTLADAMGLKPMGLTKVSYGNQEADSNVYFINLHLPNAVNLRNVTVTECYSKDDAFGIIIGMEIITIGDFAITNVAGKTTFSYRVPSIETINYVDVANQLRMASYNRGRNKQCGCGSGKKFKNCHGK